MKNGIPVYTKEQIEEKASFSIMDMEVLPDVPADSPVHSVLPSDVSLGLIVAMSEVEGAAGSIVMPESAVVTPQGTLLTFPLSEMNLK